MLGKLPRAISELKQLFQQGSNLQSVDLPLHNGKDISKNMTDV